MLEGSCGLMFSVIRDYFLRVHRKLFTCGKKKETKPVTAEGEEELTANAVIRREYVKLGTMT